MNKDQEIMAYEVSVLLTYRPFGLSRPKNAKHIFIFSLRLKDHRHRVFIFYWKKVAYSFRRPLEEHITKTKSENCI